MFKKAMLLFIFTFFNFNLLGLENHFFITDNGKKITIKISDPVSPDDATPGSKSKRIYFIQYADLTTSRATPSSDESEIPLDRHDLQIIKAILFCIERINEFERLKLNTLTAPSLKTLKQRLFVPSMGEEAYFDFINNFIRLVKLHENYESSSDSTMEYSYQFYTPARTLVRPFDPGNTKAGAKELLTPRSRGDSPGIPIWRITSTEDVIELFLGFLRTFLELEEQLEQAIALQEEASTPKAAAYTRRKKSEPFLAKVRDCFLTGTFLTLDSPSGVTELLFNKDIAEALPTPTDAAESPTKAVIKTKKSISFHTTPVSRTVIIGSPEDPLPHPPVSEEERAEDFVVSSTVSEIEAGSVEFGIGKTKTKVFVRRGRAYLPGEEYLVPKYEIRSRGASSHDFPDSLRDPILRDLKTIFSLYQAANLDIELFADLIKSEQDFSFDFKLKNTLTRVADKRYYTSIFEKLVRDLSSFSIRHKTPATGKRPGAGLARASTLAPEEQREFRTYPFRSGLIIDLLSEGLPQTILAITSVDDLMTLFDAAVSRAESARARAIQVREEAKTKVEKELAEDAKLREKITELREQAAQNGFRRSKAVMTLTALSSPTEEEGSKDSDSSGFYLSDFGDTDIESPKAKSTGRASVATSTDYDSISDDDDDDDETTVRIATPFVPVPNLCGYAAASPGLQRVFNQLGRGDSLVSKLRRKQQRTLALKQAEVSRLRANIFPW